MNMKKLFLYLSAAALAFAAISCEKKEEPYVVGDPEFENTYNVFFETLKETAFQYDPSDPTEITFKAYRDSNAVANELKVPVVLTPDAGSESIFTASELIFEKDSVWADITLKFPTAEVGTTYGATIAVTDPAYIHQYSNVPKSLSFTVQRVKWNSLGKGKYYDDLMAYWSKVPYDPVEVEFLQCDTDHSLYRIMDPYTSILSLIGATPGEDRLPYITIQVLKKGDKVGKVASTLSDVLYYDEIPTGYVHPTYALPIVLLHPINFSAGEDPAYWSHNKVVTWQDGDDPLPGEMHLAPYYYMYGLGGFNYSQYDDDIDIIFPGFVPTDYTIYLEGDYPSDGATPVYMEVGSDIASVKYAVYEGTMGENGANKKVEPITNGTDPSTTLSKFEYDDEEDIIYANFEVSPAATGLYTLVVVGYDKAGTAQGVGFLNFNFIAAEDEEEYAVSVSVGTEDISSRFEDYGFNNYNSFAYWIDGKDLTDVHVAVVPTVKVDEDALSAVKYDSQYALDEDTIAQINEDGGFATIATKLSDGLSYTVVVWATNGDLDTFAFAEYETEQIPESWKSLGTGSYTEDFFTTFWKVENLTWDVEVMQSEDDPSRYKMIYPYDAKYLYNDEGDFDTSRSYDIIVTIPDDKHVYILPQETGVSWGYGMVSIASIAGAYIDAGFTIAELEDNNIPFGTLANGEITFPVKGCFIGMSGYDGGNWYYSNANGAFKLVLPEAAAPAAAQAKPSAKPTTLKADATTVDVKVPYRTVSDIQVERTYVPVNATVTVNTDKGARVKVRSAELMK